MQLQVANKKKTKIKMALQGPSGSGKTKDALFIAFGLCGRWDKIAVIDSENRSADLYADLGNYFVLPFIAPFSPERYMEAITVCINAAIEVVIIDSLTHEWEFILDTHSGMVGNSFTNWSKLTPRHNAFVQLMLQADVHIIGTMRSKQEYVLSEKNGKQVPEKVGMKGIQREGMDYEFTLVLELDIALHAKATKDRTQLFFGKPEFIPTPETGKKIIEWCNTGSEQVVNVTKEEVIKSIAACNTHDELLSLYNSFPVYQTELLTEFTKRRQEIETIIFNQQKTIQNGTLANQQ